MKIGKRKTCGVCKKSKLRKAFAKDASRADGKMSYCRLCDSRRRKVWRAKNKARAIAYRVAWVKANLEKKHARDQRYRDAHLLLSRQKNLQQRGLTLTWFLSRLDEIDNRCERCGNEFKNRSRDCHVDHCHYHCAQCARRGRTCKSTDAIRGIVCNRCNLEMSKRYCKANSATDPYLIAYAKRVGKVAA